MKDVKENKGISKRNSTSGITLIALVITIIVLLILAGVTIATLTGDNGILNQAGNAKERTAEADAIERVKVEVLGSYGTDGKIDLDQLNKNLRNINGLTYNGSALSDSNKITTLSATVSLNGYDIVIDGNGNVTKKVTVAEAKTNGTVFGDNTPISDTYGNSITIPKGFKIASDSATDVTGGIVIEDATYRNTLGSQFVWIPVGTGNNAIKKSDGSSVEIALGRYNFTKNSDGTITTSAYSGQYKEDTKESHNSNYGNAIAKDIEAFKTSANNNHGYYMGRYEAGVDSGTLDTSQMTNSSTAPNSNWTGWTKADGTNAQIVCKEGQQVWNYVTQNKASELSRNMYDNTVPFTSDLMNSYAWDTAIVFIQTFGTKSNSATYSYQIGQSTDKPSTTGTGILSNPREVDEQCNIFDMAGNCEERTTETYSHSYYPCVPRGGDYHYSNTYPSFRGGNSTSDANSYYAFRPLLYL